MRRAVLSSNWTWFSLAALIGFFTPTPPGYGTPPPAPGVEMPEHVRQFVANTQVSIDTPGAWRDKARRARDAREAAMRGEAGGVAADNIGGVLHGTLSVPVVVVGYANVAVPAVTVSLPAELFTGPWAPMTLTQYYDEISYGNLNMTGNVIFGGNLPNNDTFYEAGINGLGGVMATFISQAVGLVDATVNFGDYDNDGHDHTPNSGDDDGVVDFIAFVHPERGAECGGAAATNIWSHSWNYFSATGGSGTLATNDARSGGGFIRINNYVIQPALACGGGLIEIGVFCHEFGHALGLPDLYDTDGNSQGLGNWCLMAGGNWNMPTSPAHMCAWSKAQLGWVMPTTVASPLGSVVIPQTETSPFALRLNLVGSSEYFLIENRQPVGSDAFLLSAGLAIYHVDGSEPNNRLQNCGAFVQTAGRHYRVALEQGDGNCNLEGNANRGDTGDLFPGSTVNRTFNSASNPSSLTNGNVNLGVAVTDISNAGSVMTAKIIPASPPIPSPTLNVDIVFLFDVSGSMTDDLPVILPQIPGIVADILTAFGSARFALASFRDFPYSPFGDPSDFAYTINQLLTTNSTLFLGAVAGLTASGGNDGPESQYEAIFQLLTGSGRDLNSDSIPGNFLGELPATPMNWDPSRIPIIYLLTDASFHDSDVEVYPGPGLLKAARRTAVHNELASSPVLRQFSYSMRTPADQSSPPTPMAVARPFHPPFWTSRQKHLRRLQAGSLFRSGRTRPICGWLSSAHLLWHKPIRSRPFRSGVWWY